VPKNTAAAMATQVTPAAAVTARLRCLRCTAEVMALSMSPNSSTLIADALN
jgi:cytochrome c-type biogenesis protein CcmH/NrfF